MDNITQLIDALQALIVELFPKSSTYLSERLEYLRDPIILGRGEKKNAFPADWNGYVKKLEKAIYWHEEINVDIDDLLCVNPDELHLVQIKYKLFQYIMANPRPEVEELFKREPKGSNELNKLCQHLAEVHAVDILTRYKMHSTMKYKLSYILHRVFLFSILAEGLKLQNIPPMQMFSNVSSPKSKNSCIPMGFDQNNRLILLCGFN